MLRSRGAGWVLKYDGPNGSVFFVIGPGLVAILSVHELGHLLVARYFGIKVQTLSVGFGPQLMNFTDRFGTSWKLRAFPIGGSCSVSDRLFPQDLWPRAAVYAAGPIFNLILAAAFCLVAPTCCKMPAGMREPIGSRQPVSPPCLKCGKQPKFVTSILEPSTGRRFTCSSASAAIEL